MNRLENKQEKISLQASCSTSSKRKLIIFEVNEVPRQVLQAYAASRPNSYLGRKLSSGSYFETRANDLDEDLLYPSQAWASINTGKPFSEHKVKWFSDPKRFEDFFWYQAMQSGLKVALVGTPHTSPAKSITGVENFKVLIPDFFAEDEYVVPERFTPLQSFNLRASMTGRRAANLKTILIDAARSFLRRPNFSDWGLGFGSTKQIASILQRVLSKRKEALRMAQFPLFASIFCREALADDVDLAILFTNHIASAMHRYLYAVPGLSSDDSPYDDAWCKKYDSEVFYSLDLLDYWISKLAKHSGPETSTVITSAIGQKVNTKLTPEIVKNYTVDYRLENLEQFLSVLGISIDGMELIGAMLPQYSFKCRDIETAKVAKAKIMQFCCPKVDRFGHYTRPINISYSENSILVSGIYLSADQNEDVFTLTVMLQPDSSGHVQIEDVAYKPAELGFNKVVVDDHHSGEHSRDGIVIYDNVPQNCLPSIGSDGFVDYLFVRKFYESILSNCET